MSDPTCDFDPSEERLDAVLAEFLDAAARGEEPDRAELLRRHADLADDLAAFFADHDRARRLAEPLRSPVGVVRYFGDYELLEEVARGGMGVVYKARQKSLDRVVALKMILAGRLAGPDDVARFHREAQMAGRLQHPGIVALHEVGEHEGQHFYSMDFVEGRSLADLVREHPLPPAVAVRYVRDVARAVQFAHENGVLHRDLKPSNVLIDRFDQPRVTDFGLARDIDAASDLTGTGAVVGTPSYMPPEQASGDRGGLSPATDTYALCAVLYELVTGRPPFRAATTLDTLWQVLHAEPASPRLLNPQVGRDLETVLLKGLQKEPAKRYARAADLADELTALLEGRPIQARPPSALEHLGRWMYRQGRTFRVAATSVAVALVLALFLWAYLDWQWQSRLGGVQFTTDGPALLTEVFDAAGEGRVVPPFTAPTQQPLRLQAGDYRVRLSATHGLSETYRLLVEPGRTDTYAIDLAGRRLTDPIPAGAVFAFVPRGPGHDLVTAVERDALTVHDAAGKLRWRVTLGPDDRPLPPGAAVVDEKRSHFFYTALPVDLLDNMGFGGDTRAPRLLEPCLDLDGDGVPDQVWTASNRSGFLALSGQDGKLLWQVADVPGVFGPWALPDGERLLLVAVSGANVLLRDGRTGDPIGEPIELGFTPGRVRLDGAALLCLAGTRLDAVDPRTGRPLREPIDLGAAPAELPADLAGAVVFRVANAAAIRAVSPATGNGLWEHALPADEGWTGHNAGAGFLREPLPVAFDGTRPGQVLVPDERGAVALLDGRSGRPLWRSRLHINQGRPSAARVLVGPDLDGDGWRDVFAANVLATGSYHGSYLRPVVRVQLLSGKTGDALWRTRFPLPDGAGYAESGQGHPLVAWQAGLDGWPLLVVPGKFHTLVVEASTGRIVHVLAGMRGPCRAADLDGDGLPELAAYQPAKDGAPPGRLHLFRGTAPEVWRRFGEWLPDRDRDGDGVVDLVRRHDPAVAVSGRDGRVLAPGERTAPADAVPLAFDPPGYGPVTVVRQQAPRATGAPATPTAEPVEYVPFPWVDRVEMAMERQALFGALAFVLWAAWRALRHGWAGLALPAALYLTLLVGLVAIYLSTHVGTREPWQRYGWDGWHAILFLTLAAAGFLVVFALALRGFVGLIRRAGGRPRSEKREALR